MFDNVMTMVRTGSKLPEKYRNMKLSPYEAARAAMLTTSEQLNVKTAMKDAPVSDSEVTPEALEVETPEQRLDDDEMSEKAYGDVEMEEIQDIMGDDMDMKYAPVDPTIVEEEDNVEEIQSEGDDNGDMNASMDEDDNEEEVEPEEEQDDMEQAPEDDDEDEEMEEPEDDMEEEVEQPEEEEQVGTSP